MNDIFVSYSSEDRQRVEPLVRAIEAHGFDAFWDREITYGDSYRRVIDEALQRAKCAIVVWSRKSVDSEWVTNEASEARQRGILVPVLLDEVQPPLEFRHLQTAELFHWTGANDDPDLQQVIAAVRSILQRGGVPPRASVPGRVSSPSSKSWWQTPAGWAVGAAALLVAAAILLLAVKQFVGSGRPEYPRGAQPEGREPQQNSGAPGPPGAPAAPAASEGTGQRPTSSDKAINLLDVHDGAQIVASSESGWKDYIFARDEPYCSVISTRGFVTFAFRDERRARFDRLGVFVEATSDYNFKTVEVYASDQSDQGPFEKVTTIAVPNYRNERQPLHEFRFEPVTARYVKLVVVDWQGGGGRPNGNVCTMELFGTLL